MSDFNSNFIDSFAIPVKEIGVLSCGTGEESVGSPVVLETLRPPVLASSDGSMTLPVPVYCFADSGGGQLDAVNNPCLMEGEGEPSSRSSECVEVRPGQGQAAIPISASGDVPGPLLGNVENVYVGGENSAFSVPVLSTPVGGSAGVESLRPVQPVAIRCTSLSESLAKELLDHVVDERGKFDFIFSHVQFILKRKMLLMWSLNFGELSRWIVCGFVVARMWVR